MTSDPERGAVLAQKYADDVGICRAFLQAAWEPTKLWTRESEQILRRAELDWNRLTYLTEAGVARPLLTRLKGADLPPWVPRFFVKGLQSRASQDAVDDLIKREALRRIVEALREIGGRGVLLKGTALMVSPRNSPGSPAQRATGDIDLYVDPPFSSTLRLRLLKDGFKGSRDARRTAPHHLAPVIFRGVAVEIHETIMPSFWGLPEPEMIARAVPVEGMEPLYRLNAEGMLLHAGIHASSHLFSNGLKSAWDLLWICNRFPELDWGRLAGWLKATALARGFWVPVRVLTEELSLPLPAEFLRHAPDDRRQIKLEMIARQRLFSTLEGPFDMNPFTKNGVFLLLHDSGMSRVRYLVSLGGGNLAESRASARKNHRSQSFQQMWAQLREAFWQLRQYQRLAARQAR